MASPDCIFLHIRRWLISWIGGLAAADVARAEERRRLLTNDAPRGTLAHVQGRVRIATMLAGEQVAAALARERATDAEKRSSRLAAALGHLTLQNDIPSRLPRAKLSEVVADMEGHLAEDSERLARLRGLESPIGGQGFAQFVAAEEAVFIRLVEELPYSQEQ